MLNRLNDIFELSEGDFNICSFWVRFLLLLIPDVVDFILTIVSYDYNCKTFFVLRFITQGIIILFCMSFACFSSYLNSDGIDAIGHVCFTSCTICFALGIEISSLVFFIKNFNELQNLGKIAYYIHFTTYLCVVFCGFINPILKKINKRYTQ